MSLATGLNAPATTSVVVDAIPDNTPAAGFIRITLDDGRKKKVEYTSYTGVTFTIVSTDFTDPEDAIATNGVMVSYLDLAADDVSEAFTTIYDSPDTLWVRVRDGGATPIKTYEGQAALGSNGGSAVASRISDE